MAVNDSYIVNCPNTSAPYCKSYTIYNTGGTTLSYSYRICGAGYDYGTIAPGGSTSVCAEYNDISIDSGDGYFIEGSLCTNIVYL